MVSKAQEIGIVGAEGDIRARKILMLAPQPFFIERGTPIAVRLLIEELLRLFPNLSIDLVTLAQGEDIPHPRLSIHRIAPQSSIKNFLNGLRPGASLKKGIADLYIAAKAHSLLRRAQAQGSQYHLIHAVEESAAIAWALKKRWGVPYLYDMDSHLSQQITAKWWWLWPCSLALRWAEKRVIRGAITTVAVCDALGKVATKSGGSRVAVLRDVSFAEPKPSENDNSTSIRAELGLDEGVPLVLYVGNFEPYQGTNLLIDSWSFAAPLGELVFIGGTAEDLGKARTRAARLPAATAKRVHFLGPRPLSSLPHLLKQANVLVSPRIHGINTPMKIYSYLASGKPIVATLIESHTQVINDSCARLVPVDHKALGQALNELLSSPEQQAKLGEAGRDLCLAEFSRARYSEAVYEVFAPLIGD